MPSFEIRACTKPEVLPLVEAYHSYESMGDSLTYCFGVFEAGTIVAAYVWQPPAPGAARGTCPEAPQAVLMLSRMVAIPRKERRLKHVSKPLKYQMKHLIDRTRWPVLITYSDEGQGHNGWVYQCSGWKPTCKNKRRICEVDGKRLSAYRNGKYGELAFTGTTIIQRWEHWICDRGSADSWMSSHGWRKIAVPGKLWRSGNQAYTYRRDEPSPQNLENPGP